MEEIQLKEESIKFLSKHGLLKKLKDDRATHLTGKSSLSNLNIMTVKRDVK